MKQTRNKYIISIYNSLFNTKNVKCNYVQIHNIKVVIGSFTYSTTYTICSRKHEFTVRIQEKVQVNVNMSTCAHKLMRYISTL